MEITPQVVNLVWQRLGRAEVNLFASSTTTHCLLWFSLSTPSPLGLDVLAHRGPRTSLYATDTIIHSRAPSTRRLFAFKWRFFASWCRQCVQHCPVGSVLEFLQSHFSRGVTPTTLKVYVAPISAGLALVGGDSVGRHPLVSHFMKGSRQLRPFRL